MRAMPRPERSIVASASASSSGARASAKRVSPTRSPSAASSASPSAIAQSSSVWCSSIQRSPEQRRSRSTIHQNVSAVSRWSRKPSPVAMRARPVPSSESVQSMRVSFVARCTSARGRRWHCGETGVSLPASSAERGDQPVVRVGVRDRRAEVAGQQRLVRERAHDEAASREPLEGVRRSACARARSCRRRRRPSRHRARRPAARRSRSATVRATRSRISSSCAQAISPTAADHDESEPGGRSESSAPISAGCPIA